MSVEFVPKNKGCYCFGVANGTWFHLLDKTGIGALVDPQHTNDPIDADKDTALKCAEALAEWEPPTGWFSRGREHTGKQIFIDFFMKCGGFTTY